MKLTKLLVPSKGKLFFCLGLIVKLLLDYNLKLLKANPIAVGIKFREISLDALKVVGLTQLHLSFFYFNIMCLELHSQGNYHLLKHKLNLIAVEKAVVVGVVPIELLSQFWLVKSSHWQD